MSDHCRRVGVMINYPYRLQVYSGSGEIASATNTSDATTSELRGPITICKAKMSLMSTGIPECQTVGNTGRLPEEEQHSGSGRTLPSGEIGPIHVCTMLQLE